MKTSKRNTRKINVYPPKKMLSIIRKVCENYAIGEYTLESVCENAGVPYRTFKHWWSMYEKEGSIDGSRWAVLAEVADLWVVSQLESKERREKELVTRAERMLLKRVQGYYYEVDEAIFKIRKDEFGETLVPVGVKKLKKYTHPSDRAIQFVLTKLYPEKYSDTPVEKATEPTNPYKNLSINEMEDKIAKTKARLDFLKSNPEKTYDELIELNGELFDYI
ncbi:hypothetical protein [Flavobacterium mekongense]|uniref:hypothetical protein n=1 Tax=Flavobacterium mekongense TaxID=3379707 RepID=UPI00399B53B2